MRIIENFKAKDYSVLNVFTEVDASFYVPIYQRKYNWIAQNEVAELISDLRIFSKTQKDNSTYYLGNIIVKAITNEITSKIEKYILIDGQQRLTTILLIVNYLKYSLLNEVHDIDEGERKSKIDSLDDILYSSKYFSNEERKLKIENDNSDEILRKIFQYTKNNDESVLYNVKDSNYYKNFEYIKNELNITSSIEWDYWLEIIKNIKIAQITLGTNDNEISVFESINSKGMKLNALDLIKNYLFLISERLKVPKDTEARIDDIFSNKLEKQFTNKKNEKDEKMINRFFAAFLTKEKLIDPVKEWKIIYREFKIEFNDDFSTIEKFNNFLSNFESTVDSYNSLLKLKNKFNNDISGKDYSKGFLLDSKFDLYLPLFLILIERNKKNELSSNELEEIFDLLDFHNLMLSVVGRINKDNKFIFSYILGVEGKVDYKSLKEFLILKGSKGNKSGFVISSDFKSHFMKQDIYNIDQKTARYILYRIENYLRNNSAEYIDFNFTIEHIFPQDNTNWKDNFNNLEYLNEYKHSIGNLTLVKQKLNSRMSNIKFKEKLEHLSNSSLKLNEYFLKLDSWNIRDDKNDVLNRAKYLFELVSKIWDISVLDDVEYDNNVDDKIFLINKFDKISIVNAFKIILFQNYPKGLTLKELEKETHNLYDFIKENDENLNIDINFSKDKISTGGWMTERLHSNWVEKKDKLRFEKEIFIRENDKWSITKKIYDDISKN